MNTFPDGQIDPTDEGEIPLNIYVKDERVVLDFGKELTWIGFDKKSLVTFIATLSMKLHELQ